MTGMHMLIIFFMYIGKYSSEEDFRLHQAVLKALRLTPTATVVEIPDGDIPWEAVAIYMNNERLGDLAFAKFQFFIC